MAELTVEQNRFSLTKQSGRTPHLTLVTAPSEELITEFLNWLASTMLCLSSNWQHNFGPCGVCSACKKVANAAHESLLILQPEKGSIKVDEASQVIDFLRLRPWAGNQVVIIKEAHLLTSQAANSLLKSLEEPPPQTYFFIGSTQSRQVIPTIRSRSQRVFISGSPAKVSPGLGTEAFALILAGDLVGAQEKILEAVGDRTDLLLLISSIEKILLQKFGEALAAGQSSATEQMSRALGLIQSSYQAASRPVDRALFAHTLAIKMHAQIARSAV